MRHITTAAITVITLMSASTAFAAKNPIADLIAGALAGGATVTAPTDAIIEVGFSPDHGAEALVVRAINASRSSIRLAAYSFTSKPVIEALIRAKKSRNVDIACVLDKSNADNKSGQAGANLLVNAGIAVRIDSAHPIHHNKYIVVDAKHLETGSFNYSSAAAHKNAENVLLLWNNPALAKEYDAEWQKHWAHSDPWRSTY